jgi:hypothetical protein
MVRRLATVAALAGVVIAALVAQPAQASFLHSSSASVALIAKNGPVPPNGPDGIMPVSGYVSGRPAESFGAFSFSNVPLSQVTSAKLAQFDTVALIQVKVENLSEPAKVALARFVADGGKLLIHDSDETKLNDYSWLLPGGYSTRVGAGCEGCGGMSGRSTITNSSLMSTNPADASYVSLGDLARFTDAVGDANLLVSTDPRWFALASGTNSNANGESGAQVAFANNNGLVVYNGFDTDFVKTNPSDPWRCNQPALGFRCPAGSTPTVDWIAHMWHTELVQGWGSTTGTSAAEELPAMVPLAKVGAVLSAASAGLPSSRQCVAGGRLRLALGRLRQLRHRKVTQIVVYVNGRLALRQRRRIGDVTLRKLPRHGSYVVEIIVTTSRGYHLVARQRYRAC